MELVYQYLTGPRFRQRLEGIVEKFDELKEDLDKKRKFMNRIHNVRARSKACWIPPSACTEIFRVSPARRSQRSRASICRCWKQLAASDGERRP